MIEKILSRLDGVKKRGPQGYMAKCPAHNDKTPSLALTELSDGRILIKCFAECSPVSILAAVGLELGDLFPDGCIGGYKSFKRLEDEYRAKQNTKLSTDETILAIAKLDRASGKRLSLKDLEIEKQAFMRIRNANSN